MFLCKNRSACLKSRQKESVQKKSIKLLINSTKPLYSSHNKSAMIKGQNFECTKIGGAENATVFCMSIVLCKIIVGDILPAKRLRDTRNEWLVFIKRVTAARGWENGGDDRKGACKLMTRREEGVHGPGWDGKPVSS